VAFAINERGRSPAPQASCAPFSPYNFLYIQTVHAILWEKGKPIDLGSLGGATGNVALRNQQPRRSGWRFRCRAGDTTTHGFLWTKETGKMQDLAPFHDDVVSTALAINDGWRCRWRIDRR
jgi:uncharacterized membrane protein